VDRIFDAMPGIEASHGQTAPKRRNIGFFGGEPLLAHNHSIVEYILNKAESLGGANFWAVSNATELQAYRDLLGPGKIARIQITLDGPSYEHDTRRIYADGQGSFQQIAENITMALELGVNVNVRMNIDRNNIDQLPVLAEQMISHGWTAYRTFNAYTAPIRASNEKTSIKTTLSAWELDQQLNALREQYPAMSVIDRPDDGKKDQIQALLDNHRAPSQRPSFCGAHSGMYIFDAFGDVYACWERTGDKNIRIGSISPAGEFISDDRSNSLWRSRTVTTNPICRKCRYAMNCGGGCAVLAENHRGEFFTNFCDGFAARFRATVAEAYQDHIIGLEPVKNREAVCDL
jgi:uncharacterized protein